MGIRTSTFRIDTDDHGAEITVAEATVYASMIQTTITIRPELREWEASLPLEEQRLAWVFATRYSSIVAYTDSIVNDEDKEPLTKDLSFDEYLVLHSSVETVWFAEILQLNPHLMPRSVETREEGESRIEAGEESVPIEA